jgi:hypothetical protein
MHFFGPDPPHSIQWFPLGGDTQETLDIRKIETLIWRKNFNEVKVVFEVIGFGSMRVTTLRGRTSRGSPGKPERPKNR